MPRSVYLNVGRDGTSRFNPINLVKRFAAVAVVMAMVLLGTASMASAAALSQPSVSQAGSGAINVTFTPDGTATLYTATSSPSGLTCVVSSASAISSGATQTCTVSGLTNGTPYTFTVTPSGNGTTSTVSPASVSITPQAALSIPTVHSLGLDSTGASDAAWVSFTADGVATSYAVTSTTNASMSVTLATSSGTTGTGSYTGATDPTSNAVLTAGTAVFNGAPSSVQITSVNTSAKTFTYSISGGTTPTVTGGSATATGTVGPTGSIAQSSPLLTGTQGVDVSGLTTGTIYVFTVTPSDSALAGTSSAYTAIATLQPAVAANTAAGSQAVVFYATGMSNTWTINAATSSGGTTVESCVVASTTSVPAGPQTCTVTGLNNGTRYYYTVSPAINNGETNTAQIGTVAQAIVSGALVVTAANNGSGSVLVSWTADGHASTYTVTSNTGTPVGTSCVVANTSVPPTGSQSCSVTNLGTNEGYTFTVTPSAYGSYTGSQSTPGTSGTVTTLKALSAPTPSVVSSSSIEATFTADGIATTYTVTAYSGVNYATAGPTCTVVSATPITNGTSSNCVITGLSSTTSYEFSVAPSGNGDTNVASAYSGALTPGSSLSAPTVATAGSGAIAVSFTADGADTQYTVTAYTNAALTTSTGLTCTVANTATPPTGTQTCTVTGLGNGTTYYFGVHATGSASPFGNSGASAGIAPTSALAAPTVKNAGSGAILVSFVADGTATTYTVTASNGLTCTVANTSTVPSGAQSCTVTGLTNGVSYTFTVKPSGGGTSTISASSLSISPGTTPLLTPTVVYGGTGAVVVSFTADGVATTYTVSSATTQANAVNGTCTVINSVTPPKGAQSCTISGLTNGDTYTFTVLPSGNATTSLVSASSAPFLVSATSVPAAATTVAATGTASALTVTWVAPTVTGGSPITGYVVTASAGNTTTSCGTVAATATTCTISGLTAGTAYAISVVAVNANGNSPVATGTGTTSAAVTPPPAGRKVPFTTGTHGVAVVGKTSTLVLLGGNFYGQPKITSNEAGTRAVVSKDSGNSITIRVTVSPGSAAGEHTMNIVLADGKSCRDNYKVIK
ncbi:MAG TPA: fibronectin type III domain-containing protein [Acidimicrobiales bacterium]